MVYAIIGFIGMLMVAIGLLGYRYETGKISRERDDKAVQERTGIKNDLAELKDLYKSKIQTTGLQFAKELSQKYDYGFVLFGILDGEFIYPTTKYDSNIEITADWDKTVLKVNENNPGVYDLTIINLRQSGKFGRNNSLNISIGTYRTAIPKLIDESTVEISVVDIFGEVRLFFELIENDNQNVPVYVIGFKR